jgi:hypothetical protein
MKQEADNRRTPLLMLYRLLYCSVYRLPRYDMQEHRPAAHVGKENGATDMWYSARGSTRVESNKEPKPRIAGIG